MELEKYDRSLVLIILVSSFIKFIAHLYNYVFYKGYFIVNGLNRAYDVPQHLVYAMEILRGEWPFQNPLAVGFPIDYPIGLPLLIAVLVGITGAHILHVFRFFPIVLNIFVGLTSYIMVSWFLHYVKVNVLVSMQRSSLSFLVDFYGLQNYSQS
jgi:hypothetical protein